MDTITVVSDYMDTDIPVSSELSTMANDYQNMLEMFKYIDEFNQ